MSIQNTTSSGFLSFRSAGVSPASKCAGGTPALCFARWAATCLAALGLVLVWTSQTLAQAASQKPQPAAPAASKKPVPKETTVTVNTMEASSTLTLTVRIIGQFPATLDQALTAAMETNPTIVAARTVVDAAKTKVTLAEAELSSARMKVAREIVRRWTEYQVQKRKYEEMLEINKRTRGTFSASQIIEVGGLVSMSEMELRSLIGQAPPPAAPSGPARRTVAFEHPPKPIQLPGGPVVEKLRNALAQTTDLDFNDFPLGDVVEYLKDTRKIEIQIDKKSLEDAGLTAETPITFKLKGVSLAGVFQALDDQYRDLKLVVRDYGILVTTPERAISEGYLPVVDFARQGEGSSTMEPKTYAPPTLELPIKETPSGPFRK
jgi:hypothetical protein